jgi:hypothetical protein
LRAELAINRGELDKFKNDIDKKKQRLASRQVQELDYYFDFSGFNYRIIDPLIMSGHFHSLLGSRLIDLEPEQDGRCEGNRR